MFYRIKEMKRNLFLISINLPYDLTQNTVVMSGLVLLVATWICWISYRNGHGRTVGPTFAALNPWVIVEMQPVQVFALGITLVDVDLNIRSARYSDSQHHFSVTVPKCYKDVFVKSLFPRTTRLRNSLPAECLFLLAYDLNSFKSRIDRHLQVLSKKLFFFL